jgi:hypothetical protein
MPKRSRKPLSDPNRAALAAVGQATADEATIQAEIEAEAATASKDPAAVTLGRRGGLKGGHARAKSLTPADRISLDESRENLDPRG